MWNKPTSLFVIAALSFSLAGCFVRTRGHSHNSGRVVSCGKHESWDGNRCVRRHDNGNHNGRGPVVRDHRR
ncbi:MAG: hypothetical protein H0T79_21115 [Deltaproteobacteria bacterium]|nr:hypothetical protein [Deltaproteobacteria bacterium]